MSKLIIKGSPNIKYYVVHNTALSRKVAPQQLKQTDDYHRTKDWGGGWRQPGPSELGWYVGYNKFTEPNGDTTQCRKVGEETIAQRGHNCSGTHDCDAISHAFAGFFRVEGMTSMQIDELKKGYWEAKAIWPDMIIVQHSDVQSGRTCAELSTPWLEALVSVPEKETKDEVIARLTKELEHRDKIIKQFISLTTILMTYIKK